MRTEPGYPPQVSTHEATPASDHPHQVCLCCGAVLRGVFCHECGQRDVDLDRSLSDLVGDALSESFEADGRLPRTLVPFFLQPGVVVRSFLRGQRRRWTSPVRIYVFALFAAFVVFGWSGGRSIAEVPDAPLTELGTDADGNRRVQVGESELTMRLDEVDEEALVLSGETTLDSALDARFARLGDLSQREIAALLIEGFLAWTPRLVTLLVPVLAVLLKVVYWRRRFLDHLVFSLDQHSRGLLLLALSVLVDVDLFANVVAVVLQLHLVLGMRVVYGRGWVGTIGRWAVLMVGYLTVLFVGMITIVLLSLAGL
jgi:hypothetical protein